MRRLASFNLTNWNPYVLKFQLVQEFKDLLVPIDKDIGYFSGDIPTSTVSDRIEKENIFKVIITADF